MPKTHSSANTLKIAALRKLDLRRVGTWETALSYFPGPIQDPEDSSRTYIPRMCLIVDEEQDFIVSHRLLEPSVNGNLSLLDTVLDAIRTHKVLPEEIHIADESIADFIEPTLNALDIGVVENPYLDGIYRVFHGMEEHFSGRL